MVSKAVDNRCVWSLRSISKFVTGVAGGLIKCDMVRHVFGKLSTTDVNKLFSKDFKRYEHRG